MRERAVVRTLSTDGATESHDSRPLCMSEWVGPRTRRRIGCHHLNRFASTKILEGMTNLLASRVNVN